MMHDEEMPKRRAITCGSSNCLHGMQLLQCPRAACPRGITPGVLLNIKE